MRTKLVLMTVDRNVLGALFLFYLPVYFGGEISKKWSSRGKPYQMGPNLSG